MTLFFIYSVCVLAFGFTLSYLWVFILSIWLIIGFYIKKTKKDQQLSSKEQKMFNYVFYIYPLIETFLKFMIEKNVIAYSWFWLNRLEHIIFSMVLGILLLPLIKKTFAKLNTFEALLYFVGLVIFIGNVNEFLEYAIRIYVTQITNNVILSAYYWDTIYDLGINLIGALLGFIIVKSIQIKNRE